MGQARRRGTFEERKAVAVSEGHTRSGWWQDHKGYTKRQQQDWIRELMPKTPAEDLLYLTQKGDK